MAEELGANLIRTRRMSEESKNTIFREMRDNLSYNIESYCLRIIEGCKIRFELYCHCHISLPIEALGPT